MTEEITTPATPAEPTQTPAPPAPAAAPAAPESKTETPPASDTPAPQTPGEKARAAMENVLGNKPAKAAEKPAETDDDTIEGLSEADLKVAKSNPKAWGVFRSQEKKWKEERKALEAKIKLAEAKPNPTAADDSRLKALEKQLEELGGKAKTYQQKLAERDYRESDEYKEKFVKPFHNAWNKGRQFVSQLQVVETRDEDGIVKSPARQATPADFDKIYNSGPQQRYALAKELFGPDLALAVVRRAEDLDGISEQEREAVAEHASNFEKIHAEREQATAKEQAQYQQLQQAAMSELQSKYPDYFSPDHYKDQPEFQKALQSGYEFLDSISQDDSMTPKDRADVAAVVRGYAASFPLLVAQRKADKAEIEALKAELGKYRQSDPGSATSKPVVTPTGDAPVGGISEFAAKFGQVS